MYKIDRTNLKKERKIWLALFFIFLIILSIVGNSLINQYIHNNDKSAFYSLIYFFLPSLGLPMCIGFWMGIIKYRMDMKKYDYLEKNGKLEKNVKYEVMTFHSDGDAIHKIVVYYELENGILVKLERYPPIDLTWEPKNGVIDVLIDTNNPKKYVLEFNIKEYDNISNN